MLIRPTEALLEISWSRTSGWMSSRKVEFLALLEGSGVAEIICIYVEERKDFRGFILLDSIHYTNF